MEQKINFFMITKISFMLFLVLKTSLGLAYASNTDNSITNYHATFLPVFNQNYQLRIAVRQYEQNSTQYFLVVNPYSMQTTIGKTRDFKFHEAPGLIRDAMNYFALRILAATPYFKALQKYSAPPYVIQNYGIKHAEYPVDGFFLTIDMCPSHKHFEKKLFETLTSLSSQKLQATPIAVAISGLWLLNHPQEFQWLIEMQRENKLDITWINHSFSHPYYGSNIPLNTNFFLNPRAPDLVSQVLKTEKLLLEHQQMPTVFFRFPGLISNADLIHKLKKLGLIAISSDAWLAKGQKPSQGSFILIHGNGNEPHGVKILLSLLHKHPLTLLPLAEAFKKF